MELLERTKVGRDVNRHYYTPDEVAEALERPVVVALMRLIRFRNTHPAFGGDLSYAGDGQAFELSWRHGEERCVLAVDLSASTYTLSWTAAGEQHSVDHISDLPF
jgi:sucrose phosphorylase